MDMRSEGAEPLTVSEEDVSCFVREGCVFEVIDQGLNRLQQKKNRDLMI